MRNRCLRNKRPSKPYDLIVFGAIDVTKSFKFKRFGNIYGTEPYITIGFVAELTWAT